MAALDNDETNKRLTFLFRFEEEFRIPLVKRQRFNSSEAEGLLVICRGCCRCSANGHGTGFPRRLLRCRGTHTGGARSLPGTGTRHWPPVPGLCCHGSGRGQLFQAMLGDGSHPTPWPAERGALVPLPPISLSPAGVQLHKQTWCCLWGKDHVHQLRGRNCCHGIRGLGRHRPSAYLETAHR